MLVTVVLIECTGVYFVTFLEGHYEWVFILTTHHLIHIHIEFLLHNVTKDPLDMV